MLDPTLIFAAGLGVRGAALASGLSFATMSVLYVSVVIRRGLLGRGRFALERLEGIVRIGLPPSLAGMFFCVIYILISPIVGHFGPAALAALGIGHRVESLGYLVGYGVSLASITLVGRLTSGFSCADPAGFSRTRLRIPGQTDRLTCLRLAVGSVSIGRTEREDGPGMVLPQLLQLIALVDR